MATSLSLPTKQSRSAAQIRAFVKEIEAVYLLESPQVIGIERRFSERMNVTMPVSVLALDDEMNPLDYRYHAVTRDISTTGVGLVTTNPIGRTHVQLTFEPYHGELFTVDSKVVYCNNIGYYFQIGCEFISMSTG